MNGNKRMIMIWLAGIIVAIAVFAAAWYFLFGMPNPQLSQGQVSITPSSTISSADVSEGRLRIDGAAWNVEIASTTVEQTRGLSYRASLGENDGMLFIFGRSSVQSFWMIGMNFPLDIIWIGDDGAGGNKVLGFAQNVPQPAPGAATWNLPTYSSPAGVDKVLEVNAGSVVKYGIKVGDQVAIPPLSAI